MHYIYCYTNKINGKKYIGRTINTKQRFRQHKTSHNRSNTTFHAAIKKYGIDSFEVEILEETTNPKERETFYIQKFNTMRPNGYNMKEFDMDMTEEIRDKISRGNTGKTRSQEHKAAISNAQKGTNKTLEHKQLIAQSHIGIGHTNDTKKKLADHFAKKWIITHPGGKEETIKNLNAFCKEHGLNQGNMANVASGRKKSCKGYKVRSATEQHVYEITSWIGNCPGIEISGASDKYKECLSYNIRLFTIFEHEWKNRQSQIKNFLSGALGRNTIKIYARDCHVQIYKTLDNQVLQFFEDYHIQGRPHSYETCIALTHNNLIIGAMSFGRHHRQGHEDVNILSRLCWKTNHTVVGGSARLFSYRPKDKNIVSWSDNRWSDVGGVYQRLGFVLDREYGPDYHYVNSFGEVKQKQSMQKRLIGCRPGQTELERATELGWTRVYDSGKKKWVFNKT